MFSERKKKTKKEQPTNDEKWGWCDSNFKWGTRNNHQESEKDISVIKDRWKNRDYSDHSSIKIG